VPATLDDAAFENLRLSIEKSLRENQDRDDRENGWQETLF